MDLVAPNSHLVLQRKGESEETLEPAFRDAFFCDAAQGVIRFSRDRMGKINGVQAINHRLLRIRFDKVMRGRD